MPQNGEDCESAHTLVRNDLGYARLNADYFGLKNIKPDKLPPAGLGSVFEVPQSSLQIDQACVSRGGAVRANSSPDIRDSCASRTSWDVYGFRPEYHTCVGFLILVTLAPWTQAWPRRHHYKCVRFAGSAQRHEELCPWRKRQPYLRKKRNTTTTIMSCSDSSSCSSSTTIRSNSRNQSGSGSSSKIKDCSKVYTFSDRRRQSHVWILRRILSTSRCGSM